MKHFARGAYAMLRTPLLTVWLGGGFIVYYLTVAVWSTEAFGHFIQGISSNNAMRLWYVLFTLNVLLRSIDAGKALWSKDRRRLFLRMPLYGGIVLFLVSSFMGVNVKKHLWHEPVGKGDVVRIPWSGEIFQVAAIKSAYAKKKFGVNDAILFDYEPGVTLVDEKSSVYNVGAFPVSKVHSLYMHVLRFGISPGMELRQDGKVVAAQNIPLQLTPFGNTDSFHISDLPYDFKLTVVPNRYSTQGKESVPEYIVEKPAYRIEIQKGDQALRSVETDTGVRIDDSITISFTQPTEWVILEIVQDPFYPFFLLSLFLLCCGVVLYPFSFFRSTIHPR